MAYGQIITNSVTDLNITDEKLATTLDLSSKSITLPNASITIDKVLTAGNTTSNNLTVNNLTVNGTLSGAGAGVTPTLAIAYAVALG